MEFLWWQVSKMGTCVRTIFAQPTQETAKPQLAVVAEQLKAKFPKAMNVLERAEEDVLAYRLFPKEHWKQICSTNPLERLKRELRRRFDVVGIFPNRHSVVRLGGAILQEQNDEWIVARRYFSRESMAKLIGTAEQQLLAATSVLHK
jgi:putative transposase